MNDLLTCHHLSKIYQEGQVKTQVLSNITFTLHVGESVAIVGSSGSGKSTLLHLLGGLDQPTAGDIIFKDKNINRLTNNEKACLRNQELGFIYQFHHLLPDFTALENVAMPLLIGGMASHEAKQRATEILAAVGLAQRTHHRPAELSGGERQRVAIARALINRPSLVLADEPTGNLDEQTAETIFTLMLELNTRYQTTFLVVTHDLKLAKRLGRCLEMRNGSLIEQEN